MIRSNCVSMEERESVACFSRSHIGREVDAKSVDSISVQTVDLNARSRETNFFFCKSREATDSQSREEKRWRRTGGSDGVY